MFLKYSTLNCGFSVVLIFFAQDWCACTPIKVSVFEFHFPNAVLDKYNLEPIRKQTNESIEWKGLD